MPTDSKTPSGWTRISTAADLAPESAYVKNHELTPEFEGATEEPTQSDGTQEAETGKSGEDMATGNRQRFDEIKSECKMSGPKLEPDLDSSP